MDWNEDKGNGMIPNEWEWSDDKGSEKSGKMTKNETMTKSLNDNNNGMTANETTTMEWSSHIVLISLSCSRSSTQLHSFFVVHLLAFNLFCRRFVLCRRFSLVHHFNLWIVSFLGHFAPASVISLHHFRCHRFFPSVVLSLILSLFHTLCPRFNLFPSNHSLKCPFTLCLHFILLVVSSAVGLFYQHS